MSQVEEVLITSCKTSLQVWSSQGSGSMNTIHTYKNTGEVVTNSLNLINNRLVLTAHQGKPLLHVWPINSPDEIKNPRFILPGPANVCQVTPDGYYLVAGINRTLYVWQISSGILLTAQEIHLCAITCIAFSLNSSHILIGAANGCVLVYNFVHLISVDDTHYAQKELGKVKPTHNILHHTNAVTDIYVELTNINRRFVTSSLDNSFFIYNLHGGEPLLHVICNEPITSMKVDVTFWNIYLGHSGGDIVQFSLRNSASGLVHFTAPSDHLRFSGHGDRINCINLNRTNEILVSGSDDRCVIVWNVESKQILNKLELKTSITNVKFLLNTNLFDPLYQPKFIVKELQRNLEASTYKSYECCVYQDTSFTCQRNDGKYPNSDEVESLRKRLHFVSHVNHRLVKKLKSGTV
ncbi:hypothetical protein RI129_013265 [Pyrocoelia pectoralis]|uniref:Uncharacterized protein n=1 Tax=Pyrocoelia pectoralis TaxID=417401 RepID=A0AAN7UW36_9COLE